MANSAPMAMKITRCTMHNGHGSWRSTYCRYSAEQNRTPTVSAPSRYSQRRGIPFQSFNMSVSLIYPRGLDRLEYLLAAAAVVIIETIQIEHIVVQIGEAHRARVGVGIFFRQRDRDVAHVDPLHFLPPSFAMLMVYLGISTTRSCLPTMAWQLRRDLASSPHALSSISSSRSVASSRLSNPSRTMTWQVVQAQDFSQACSISMSCSSSASQMEVPGSASNSAPFGHNSSCGSTMICVISALQFR